METTMWGFMDDLNIIPPLGVLSEYLFMFLCIYLLIVIIFICICLFNLVTGHFCKQNRKDKTKFEFWNCICIDNFPMNKGLLYIETEILVRGNRRKMKRVQSKTKRKQLCGNDLIEFQLCYCLYVFKHLIPHCRKKLIELICTIWTLTSVNMLAVSRWVIQWDIFVCF